jgi:anti-sigma factor RsiW
MRTTFTKIIVGLGLSLGLASPLAACLTSHQACAAEATTAETKPDSGKLTSHLQAHVTYPATRAQVLAACKQMMEFTAGEKAWFAARLPEGNYQNAGEVLKAIGK